MCIHTIEYYLAIKRNEVMIYDTTWVNLENIMVGEKGKIRSHIVRIYLYGMSRIGKSMRQEES